MATPGLPSRPRLSAAIVALDDHDLLPETIESLRTIADDIAVLRMSNPGGCDPFPQLDGVVVHYAAWKQHFSAARNQLLNKVTGDWVLWLEPGERLEAGSAGPLRAFIDREAEAGRAYALFVEAPPAPPDASPEQAIRVRLMPNRADLYFQGRVRESLRPAMDAARVELDLAPGRVFRHPRHNDPAVKARNGRRNLDLIALERASAGPADFRLLLATGEAASDVGDRTLAQEAFAQTVRAAPRGSTEMLEAYYGLLASFEASPADQARQVTVCLEALEVYPLDTQLLCAMGSFLQGQGHLELAARAFELAVKYGQVDLQTWHLRDIRDIAASCLALCLQLLRRDDEARCVLEEVIERSPGSIRIRRQLVHWHVKRAERDEAIRVAEGIAAGPEHGEPLRDAIRGACEAAKEQWTAALGYLQSAYLAGCRDPICLRWLAIVLLSRGQAEAAEPLLREWQALEPSNPEVRTYLEALRAGAARGGPAVATLETDSLRWLRVDPATSPLDTALLSPPVVGQIPSSD